ncbi:class I SAM-dependent methyltransferase [Pseudarthrobacter sp. NPDC058362]|uniref:class I SAM-dependent methyltransferase n=1 Tax=Pseudarthrobacter sp. NPDC058362 TaxID=3346458 RepID=UPI0036638B77
MKAFTSALRKYLMTPRLIRLARSAPKDRPLAWERYWAGISATGSAGEVLWDSGSDREFQGYRDVLLRHFDPELPVVDVGCGHGRFTRALAGTFRQVVGVDISRHAVEQARAEQALPGTERGTITYEVCDMTSPRAGAGLVEAPGANVFLRGVLHVLRRKDQAALAENLRILAGSRGAVFLVETNFRGSPVSYASHLGATFRSIPAPLERAIRGLPMPGHFGPEERLRVLSPAVWDLLEDGPAVIDTHPLTGVAGRNHVPGYYAVLRQHK